MKHYLKIQIFLRMYNIYWYSNCCRFLKNSMNIYRHKDTVEELGSRFFLLFPRYRYSHFFQKKPYVITLLMFIPYGAIADLRFCSSLRQCGNV